MYHVNIQSSKNKIASLQSIVDTNDIDLVTVNETNLRKNDKFFLEGYKSFTKNRQNAHMGGIATSIANKYSNDALKISEGDKDEYIVTRHGQFHPAVNVINFYGAQESRKTVDEVKESWDKILKEIIDIEAKEELLVLVGDLNVHCGKLVKDNNEKVSVGGKIINKIINEGDYVLLNSHEKTTGGPFTHYAAKDPHNNEKKSLLDYVIVSKKLEEYLIKMEIDSALNWTPARSEKGKLKFTDHYAINISFNKVPMRKNFNLPALKHTRWNTRKKNGWAKYASKTEDNEAFNRAASMESNDPEKVLKIIEKELNKIKYSSFGKVKLSSKDKNAKN